LNFDDKKNKECLQKNIVFQHPKNNKYQAVFPFIIDYNEATNNIFNNLLSDNNGIHIDDWLKKSTKTKEKSDMDYFNKMKQEISYKLNSSVYELITSQSVVNTFNYLFQKFATGIYVQIKNNKLSNFVPFINTNFVNDWSKLIKLPNSINTLEEFFEKKKKEIGGKYDIQKNIDLWTASNCLIQDEKMNNINDSNWVEIYQMIDEACKNNVINDVEFFMNLKSFPLLRNDFTEPFDYIYGKSKLLTSQYYTSYHPILSIATNDDFGDLTYPTAEDWRLVTKEYFRNKCENKYIHKCNKEQGNFEASNTNDCEVLEWSDKINKAYFLGDTSGCGTTIQDNIKLKLVDLGKKNKDLMDVNITRFSKRDKIDFNTKEIKYIKPDTLPFDSVGLQPGKHHNYKYLISIPSYTTDYEFPYYLSMGGLILKIENEYSSWYDNLLKPYVHYLPVKSNLSNLIPLIKWANTHQESAQKIAKNGYIAYKKFFNKKMILDYWQNLLNSISVHRLNLSSLEERYQQYESQLKIIPQILMPPPDIDKVNFKDNKLAIIIPFIKLDQKHRAVFKEYIESLPKLLAEYPKLKYKIIACEQFQDNRKFNKGQLINIGVLIAKAHHCTHILISSINTKIRSDIVPYFFSFNEANSSVINIAFSWSDYYQKNYLSGLSLWNINTLINIGGFPNQIWNWGCADRIIYHRYYKYIKKNNHKYGIKIPILKNGIEKYGLGDLGQIIDPQYQHLKIINDWNIKEYEDVKIIDKLIDNIDNIINYQKNKKKTEEINEDKDINLINIEDYSGNIEETEKYQEKLKLIEKIEHQKNVDHYVFKLFSDFDLK
jgi:hypothetical protein